MFRPVRCKPFLALNSGTSSEPDPEGLKQLHQLNAKNKNFDLPKRQTNKFGDLRSQGRSPGPVPGSEGSTPGSMDLMLGTPGVVPGTPGLVPGSRALAPGSQGQSQKVAR